MFPDKAFFQTERTLLLIGNPNAVHVGAHLKHAATALGLAVSLEDIQQAFGHGLAAKWAWWMRGRRPLYLEQFSRRIQRLCEQDPPRLLLSTGLAPLTRETLTSIKRKGVRTANFLTDDLWNPAHSAAWFMEAIPCYDAVFSPRKANIADLEKLGCAVHYLPFAYAPEIHFKAAALDEMEIKRFASDLLFIGGADPDRWNLIRPVIREKINLALYGGYWERFPGAKPYAKGPASPELMRKAVSGAKVALCLVRRANRDGHSMRTFELPAMGACLLTEDTREHRDIFGPEGTATVYFKNGAEMVEKLRWLLADEAERNRLAAASTRIVLDGKHTYQDRLETILETLHLKQG